MKYKSSCSLLCVLSLVAAPVLADNTKAPQAAATPQSSDVTMTVIPADHDVAKTVAQVINVPSKLPANKAGHVSAHGKPGVSADATGNQTTDAARQIEDTRDASDAAQHQAEDSAAQAAQQAEHAAENQAQNQAQQAEQAQQQAQDQGDQHQPPSPPPPPSGGGG